MGAGRGARGAGRVARGAGRGARGGGGRGGSRFARVGGGIRNQVLNLAYSSTKWYRGISAFGHQGRMNEPEMQNHILYIVVIEVNVVYPT
eukprot:SAG31_NODE_697_length_12745_cov_67.888502_15_plen_90_part_00